MEARSAGTAPVTRRVLRRLLGHALSAALMFVSVFLVAVADIAIYVDGHVATGIGYLCVGIGVGLLGVVGCRLILRKTPRTPWLAAPFVAPLFVVLARFT